MSSSGARARSSGRSRSLRGSRRLDGNLSPAARTVAALLFLSPDPVTGASLAEALEREEGDLEPALAELRDCFAEGAAWASCCREVGGRVHVCLRPGGRGRGSAPACQAAHAAALAGAGRVPGDRRLPAAGVAPGGGAHPGRRLRLGDVDPRGARADRGARAVAVRRDPVPDHTAVREACSASRRSMPCRTDLDLRAQRRGRPGAARQAAPGG